MQTIKEIKQGLFKCMDNIGIILENDDDKDFDLSEYIFDSITYINFLYQIEEYFSLELNDEMFLVNSMNSFNNYCQLIQQALKNQK